MKNEHYEKLLTHAQERLMDMRADQSRTLFCLTAYRYLALFGWLAFVAAVWVQP